MDDVRFAVVATGPALPRWLQAAAGMAGARITAIHDPSSSAARAAAETHGCEVMDDPRVLLVQAPVDALLLSLSPAENHRYLPLAAERGLPTALLAPCVRSLDEAATHVRAFAGRRLPLLIASAWSDHPESPIHGLRDQQLGRIVSAHADVVCPVPAQWGWQGDRVAAGGGALMSAAYEAIHLLMTAVGMPDDLLATLSRGPWPRAGPYDVEDQATMLMRYATRRTATVRAAWGGGPAEWRVRVTGEARTRIVREDTVTDCDSDTGNDVVESRMAQTLDQRMIESCRRAIRQLICHVRGSAPDDPSAVATLREHLPTLAVIETAYLSARTAAPESPRRLAERLCGDLLEQH